jgi:hypothetical protein
MPGPRAQMPCERSRPVLPSTTRLPPASNYDEIMLFEHGVDKIDLSAIDADIHEDGDQAFKLVDSFTGEAGQLDVLVTDGGANGYAYLRGDVDGDAVADLFIRFYLPSLPPTESDILL